MEKHKIGLAGENWATIFLWLHGIRIVKRNWRTKSFEIDIVGYCKQTIILFEVKSMLLTAKSIFTSPRFRVKPKQIRHLEQAANCLINKSMNVQFQTRFDIVEVIMKKREIPVIKWIKSVLNE